MTLNVLQSDLMVIRSNLSILVEKPPNCSFPKLRIWNLWLNFCDAICLLIYLVNKLARVAHPYVMLRLVLLVSKIFQENRESSSRDTLTGGGRRV